MICKEHCLYLINSLVTSDENLVSGTKLQRYYKELGGKAFKLIQGERAHAEPLARAGTAFEF